MILEWTVMASIFPVCFCDLGSLLSLRIQQLCAFSFCYSPTVSWIHCTLLSLFILECTFSAGPIGGRGGFHDVMLVCEYQECTSLFF